MLSEKEKLEEELRFLRESHDIGVITDEEFENGKHRIEAKIRHLEEKENDGDGLFKEETERTNGDNGKTDDTLDKEEQQTKLDDRGKESIKPAFLRKEQEKKGLEADRGKEEGTIKIEPEDEEKEEGYKEEPLPLDSEKKETKEEKIKAARKQHEEAEDEIKLGKKTLVFAAVFIIAAIGIWYLFFNGTFGNAIVPEDTNNMANNAAALAACYSDNDCKAKGKIGTCMDPGQENAECSFMDDVKVKLSIINTEGCFNCDTGRIISILEEFYPNLDVEEIDYDAAGGNALMKRFNINALPAYILNSSLAETYNYEKFSPAFNKINGNFVMKDTVSNANYYINRNEAGNRLDLFVQEGQEASARAEANLQKFLGAFGEKIIFEKHDSGSALAKELGLNSFPTFLINNKIKFGGVQAANTIKENFCRMNDLEECDMELSKSLI